MMDAEQIALVLALAVVAWAYRKVEGAAARKEDE
jgi:hypothetical protein